MIEDRNQQVGTLVVEGTVWLSQYLEGAAAIEDLGWGSGAPREGGGYADLRRPITMTIENRGAAVSLRRFERLVWTPERGEQKIWYGVDFRYVELRVWHDGSVSVEEERDR